MARKPRVTPPAQPGPVVVTYRAIKRYAYMSEAGRQSMKPGETRVLAEFEAARGLELGRIERV